MGNKNTKFFDDLSKGATWSAGVAFKRSNPLPLDRYSVFETKALAEAYATSNAVAYPGQVITVAEGNKMVAYVLAENTEGTKLELQQIGIIPTGDGKTIDVTENGVISLLAADAQVDEKNEAGEATGNKVVNAGSQLTLQADGTIKWVKPDTSTAEGQAAAIKALQDNDALINPIVVKPIEGAEPKPESNLWDALDAEAITRAEADKSLGDRIDVLEKKEDKDTTYSVKDGEKVLSLDGTAFGTTLKIVYADGKIKLLGIGDALISEFDASAFVADGVLEDANYEAETKDLIFTWNIVTGTDEEGNPIYKTDRVNIGDLVDTYTAGNGLDLTDGQFSVKLAENSEMFLTVDTNGIKLSGVQNAIDAAEGRAATDAQSKADKALEDAKADTDTKLANYYKKTETYSQTEVNELIKDFATDKEVEDAVAAEAARADKAEKANADAITAIKADATIVTFKGVEEALAGKQATGDYATKTEAQGYADAKDTAISAAQGKADSAYTLAQGAQAAAEAAQSTANTNAANTDELEKVLYGRVITGSEEYPETVESGIIGDLANARTRLSTVEGTLSAIGEGTYKVPEAVNADKLDGKDSSDFEVAGAAAQALADAKTWVGEQDYSTNTRVKGLEDRIKAEEDKVDNDTTYTFEDGTEGTFKVTAKGGTVQTVNTGAKAYTDTAIASALAEAKKYTDDNDADTKYGIVYDKTNKKIKLTNNVSETEIDATDFIKDGMIESVTLSDDGLNLIITWNTDAGKTDVTTIPLSGLVDVYTGVDGSEIKVSVSNDNKISAELKATVTEDIAKGVAAKTTIDTYGDIVTHNASEFAPSDINTGVMSVTSLHDAIVVENTDGAITINFADEIILNGGGANVAAE